MDDFTALGLKTLRRDLEVALARVGATHGLSFTIGRIGFSATEFHAKLECKVAGADSRADKQLMAQMASLHLKKDGLGGRTLTGYNPKAHAYPFQYSQCGKNYKCDSASAQRFFGV
jgi:hypothetical protein